MVKMEELQNTPTGQGKSEKTGKKAYRIKALSRIGLVLIIIVAINVIAQSFYTRVDMTSDKRYTLSPVTKDILRKQKDPVYIKVYLEGEDLRPDLAKLNRSIRELLEEFQGYAGNNIQYQFINPDELDAETRKNLFKQLFELGLPPAVINDRATGQVTEKRIIPGALVTYNGRDMAVQLYQEGSNNAGQDIGLENAIIGLEYQFVNAIHKLHVNDKRKIGIIQGHGELQPIELADIYGSLSQNYTVDYIRLPEYKVGRLNEYAAIIIAKPDSAFNELEKYKIDQYIMGGGSVLWCIDALNASMDSLTTRAGTITGDLNLNIFSDLLFGYGVRINPDLVMDASCNVIPMVNRTGGGKGFVPGSWPYFPVVNTPMGNGHPIVNNLSPIWFQFVSSIDTLSGKHNKQIKKTILLHSSPDTRIAMNPVNINIATSINYQRDLEANMYSQPAKNLAVLLEGSFHTAFATKVPDPRVLASGEYGKFIEDGKPTKMIVIADGDIIRNDVNKSQMMPFRLGFDKYTRQMFGNKDFILNCIDYLLDDQGLLSLRSKDIKIRPLDPNVAKASKAGLQLRNIVLPLILISIFGILYNYIRKRRFA